MATLAEHLSPGAIMPISSLRRKIVPLILAVTLTASWAGARAGHPQAPTAVSLLERLGRAWSLLASAWGKTGCHIDPSGGCANAVETDEGCNIDPNGLCAKAADSSPRRTDTGCNIDPDGRCR
jgi:hypothetical protein